MRTSLQMFEFILVTLILAVLGHPVSQAGFSEHVEQFSKATDLFVAKRYEEALPHARKAVEEFDESAMAHGLLGHILLNLGEYRESEQSLRKAFSLPRGAAVPGIHLTLAMSILKPQQSNSGAHSPEELERTKEALRFMDMSPPAEQEDKGTLQLRGEALARLGQSEEAIRVYEKLFRSRAINYQQQAAGPLFRLYSSGGEIGEALTKLKQTAQDSGVDPFRAVSGAHAGLFLQGEHALAHDLMMTHVSTMEATSPVRLMIDKGGLCDESALDRYFASDPPAADGVVVGGLVLTTECETGQKDGEVTAPVRKRSVNPNYPEIARLARTEAVVLLRATIGRDGKPSNIRAMPNTTLEIQMGFEDAAIEAVRQWRYKPAKQEGKSVETQITVVIEFKLS